MSEIEIKNRSHSKCKSGAKANKKAKNTPHEGNSKGFSIQKVNKAKKIVQRTLDHQVSKHHLPTNQAIVDCDPPLIVAIFGPPKSGKTTLLRGLVNNFSNQNITQLTGPITVVAGKNIRLTFIECSCDMNQMIDISKVCDILLLTVNTRVGLENYHFEFINLIQVHGMPRVVPILNHIDTFHDNQSTREKIKRLKARIWNDLNAKIFPFKKFLPRKGVIVKQNNIDSFEGNYSGNEIKRLARLISVKVPRVTDWRLEHPYLLVDRIEENTGFKSDKDEKSVHLYGWVRGSVIPPALTCPGVHIIGLGDFCLNEITKQPDPCPNPRQLALSTNTSMKEIKRKMLTEKDRKIYAPMSNVGGVLFEKDSTYIDIGGSHHLRQEKIRPNSNLNQPSADARVINEAHEQISGMNDYFGDRLKESEIKLFSDGSMAKNFADNPAERQEMDIDEMDSAFDDDEEEEESMSEGEESNDAFDQLQEGGNKLEDEDVVAGFLKPVDGDSVVKKKKEKFQDLFMAFDSIDFTYDTNVKVNWTKYIYENGEINFEWKDDPLRLVDRVTLRADDWKDDSTVACNNRFMNQKDSKKSWTDQNSWDSIIDRFTTGQWNDEEDANALISADNLAIKKKKEAILKLLENERKSSVKYREENSDEENDNYEDSGDSTDDSEQESEEEVAKDTTEPSEINTDEFEKKLLRLSKGEKRALKKSKHREVIQTLLNSASMNKDGTLMSANYDKLHEKHQTQLELNKKILDSLSPEEQEALEGFPPGSYVKIRIDNIAADFIDSFNPRKALIIGGLSKREEAMGFIKTRLLTHRWSNRILKSFDPVMISIGWRRYQTVAVYAKEEDNLRLRYLKYSLKHHHCHAIIYGPICAPRTGFITFSNVAWRSNEDASLNFRVTSTGVVLSTNDSFDVMKKLKLVGEPKKIFSKTAFITGMFNSPLEVNKMIGSKLQTASKIRGIIKAALTGKKEHAPGDFRATFEASLKKADLVFLRSFVKVDLIKFFNPVLDFVGSAVVGENSGWRMMRTCGEMRKSTETRGNLKMDSLYKPVKRAPFIPLPLEIPVTLAAALPYEHKPKMTQTEARRFIRKTLLSKGKSVEELPFDMDLLEVRDIPEEVIPRTVLMDDIEAGGDKALMVKKDGEYQVVPKENRKDFMNRLRDVYNDDKVKRQEAKKLRVEKFIKTREVESKEAEQKAKMKRKQHFKNNKSAQKSTKGSK